MKIINRLVAAAAASLFALSLVGCSDNSSGQQTPDKPTTTSSQANKSDSDYFQEALAAKGWKLADHAVTACADSSNGQTCAALVVHSAAPKGSCWITFFVDFDEGGKVTRFAMKKPGTKDVQVGKDNPVADETTSLACHS